MRSIGIGRNGLSTVAVLGALLLTAGACGSSHSASAGASPTGPSASGSGSAASDLAYARAQVAKYAGTPEVAAVEPLTKPVTTERPEAVAAGTAELVGTDPERIVQRASELLSDTAAYARMSRAVNPYGDGRAAPRVLDAFRWYSGVGERPQEFA